MSASAKASNFDEILKFTLEAEGGFVNHPRDPGAATNKGITIATFRSWRRDNRASVAQLKKITDDEVRAIYYELFWLPVRGDEVGEIAPGVDLMLFDMGVNAGVGRSVRFLQNAIGTDLTGVFGPITMGLFREKVTAPNGTNALIFSLGTLHDAHYRSLTNLFEVFGRGWTARLQRRLTLAQALASTRGTA